MILFVCTGNTCRSPIAEALAQHEFMERARLGGKGARPQVESAGVAASRGEPMTREAQEALREMGVDPGRHKAQALTVELVRKAEVIYAMTASHAARARSLDPAHAAKVQTLDPRGEDVLDPIGGTIEDYRRCAARIQELVRARLNEMSRT